LYDFGIDQSICAVMDEELLDLLLISYRRTGCKG